MCGMSRRIYRWCQSSDESTLWPRVPRRLHVCLLISCSRSKMKLKLTQPSTPWLTTRRRTCPICKGDVVRSLASGSRSPSSPRYERFRDDDDDDEDIQDQVAGTINDSDSANLPLPSARNEDGDNDLESGVRGSGRSERTSERPRIWYASGWVNSLTNLGSGSRTRTQEDRSR